MLETICLMARTSLLGVLYKFGSLIGGVLDITSILMIVMTK